MSLSNTHKNAHVTGTIPTVSQSSGSMTYGVLSNGQNVWSDQIYTFHNLSPELATAGSRVYQGPHQVSTGYTLTFSSGSAGTFWGLLSQGRTGNYATTLASAGWTSMGSLTAQWFNAGGSYSTFDVYSKSSDGSALTLPAASGVNLVMVFAWTPFSPTATPTSNRETKFTIYVFETNKAHPTLTPTLTPTPTPTLTLTQPQP